MAIPVLKNYIDGRWTASDADSLISTEMAATGSSTHSLWPPGRLPGSGSPPRAEIRLSSQGVLSEKPLEWGHAGGGDW